MKQVICMQRVEIFESRETYDMLVHLWENSPKKFLSKVTRERCRDVCVFCSTWQERPRTLVATVVDTGCHTHYSIQIFVCTTCMTGKAGYLKKGSAIVLKDTTCFVA